MTCGRMWLYVLQQAGVYKALLTPRLAPVLVGERGRRVGWSSTTTAVLDRVPNPVIPIQGRTLLQCKKGGSILKFEAPNL